MKYLWQNGVDFLLQILVQKCVFWSKTSANQELDAHDGACQEVLYFSLRLHRLQDICI